VPNGPRRRAVNLTNAEAVERFWDAYHLFFGRTIEKPSK
jgi:hypothetical protein